MVEYDEALLKLVISNRQLAKVFEPAVADLYHPAPRLLLGRISPLGIGLRAATYDMRDVAMQLEELQYTPTSISGIGAQMLTAPLAWCFALDHDGLQHLIELRNVMHIGHGHDERQRDTTTVYQQVPLALFPLPDQSGCVPPPLAPGLA